MNESIAIKILKDYFENHGYKPKRLNPNDFDNGKKAPDFEIYESKKIKFVCELKSPNLQIDKTTGLFKWTTTASKLRWMLHKAVKQFKNYDLDHFLPRVLVFTSGHMQLNWTNLTHTLNGVVGFKQTVIKDLRNMDFIKRTDSDLTEIDFIIWLQVSSKDKKIHQYVPFINLESGLSKEVAEIADKIRPIKQDNIKDKNIRLYT